jgi:homoserine dehydrogenase
MTEQDRSYADALREAQERGYAKADPTLDVNGTDAAHKLSILAQIAFGIAVPPGSISRRGISDIQQADIHFARELGYTIKLLAEAWLDERHKELALHVAPVLLRKLSPLAQVRDAFNAVNVVGDVVGQNLYYGRGAGQMPTASAVVADIIDMAVGRAQRTFQTLRLWSDRDHGIRLRSAATVKSRFYLRLLVQDRPGALAEVAGILARHQISIASVIQHEALEEHEGDNVHLVIMTHGALTGNFLATLEELNRLESVSGPCVYYPVED